MKPYLVLVITSRCNGKVWTNLAKTEALERGGHSEACVADPEKVRLSQVEGQMKEAAGNVVQPMPQLYHQIRKLYKFLCLMR